MLRFILVFVKNKFYFIEFLKYKALIAL